MHTAEKEEKKSGGKLFPSPFLRLFEKDEQEGKTPDGVKTTAKEADSQKKRRIVCFLTDPDRSVN